MIFGLFCWYSNVMILYEYSFYIVFCQTVNHRIMKVFIVFALAVLTGKVFFLFTEQYVD